METHSQSWWYRTHNEAYVWRLVFMNLFLSRLRFPVPKIIGENITVLSFLGEFRRINTREVIYRCVALCFVASKYIVFKFKERRNCWKSKISSQCLNDKFPLNWVFFIVTLSDALMFWRNKIDIGRLQYWSLS